ncbi:hypothetical protein F4778DRAFT_737672 [Xylariomycetidae sp. FL2044]|nr:hypothetical protein F4778DRAFT_737672 [Xylariomycetidae sp. FL2044]
MPTLLRTISVHAVAYQTVFTALFTFLARMLIAQLRGTAGADDVGLRVCGNGKPPCGTHYCVHLGALLSLVSVLGLILGGGLAVGVVYALSCFLAGGY